MATNHRPSSSSVHRNLKCSSDRKCSSDLKCSSEQPLPICSSILGKRKDCDSSTKTSGDPLVAKVSTMKLSNLEAWKDLFLKGYIPQKKIKVSELVVGEHILSIWSPEEGRNSSSGCSKSRSKAGSSRPHSRSTSNVGCSEFDYDPEEIRMGECATILNELIDLPFPTYMIALETLKDKFMCINFIKMCWGNRYKWLRHITQNPEERKMYDQWMRHNHPEEEVKPSAEKWMNTPVHNYEKLSLLFGRDRANGSFAETAKEKASRWGREKDQMRDGLGEEDDVNKVAENVLTDEQNCDEISQTPTKSPTSSSSKKRKIEHSLEETVKLFAASMQHSSDTLKESLMERNQILRMSVEKNQQPHVYREEEVYEELKRNRWCIDLMVLPEAQYTDENIEF